MQGVQPFDWALGLCPGFPPFIPAAVGSISNEDQQSTTIKTDRVCMNEDVWIELNQTKNSANRRNYARRNYHYNPSNGRGSAGRTDAPAQFHEVPGSTRPVSGWCQYD